MPDLSDLLKKDKELNPQPSSAEKKELADLLGMKRGTGESAKMGNKFENELKLTCQIYADRELAWIQKFTPPTIWVPPKNGKAGFMMYTAKTGFDFVGFDLKTGQGMAFEAKSSKEGFIGVWQEKSGIKTHQIEIMLALEKFHTMNIFFLWRIVNADSVVYRFTPTQMLEAILNKKSLTIADCEDNHFPRMIKKEVGPVEIYDFMDYFE